MKVSAGQINGQIDRLASDVRLYLFHGPDEAGAQALAERLARAVGPDAERIDIEPAALRSNPGLLADEAASISLFGGSRFIRVSGAGEEVLAACSTLLDAPQAGNPVVVIAPGVKTSGKLVKAAIAAPGAVSFGCYVPEGAEASRIAAAMARDTGLRLTGDAPARLWEATGGDRAILAREIEKLAMFLDAAPDRPRDADGATLDAIGANLESVEMFGAIDAIIGGNAAEAGSELTALDEAGISAIPLLRQLARRMLTLATLRAEVDAGDSIDEVIARHRIFFREKAATSRALRKWNSRQIAHAIDRIREAERATMANSTLDNLLAEQMGVAMARAASRSGQTRR
ncbi:DNA polymerase III subunit delta [Stakelama marina]|uniref:DNA-directed DNA polymerase n=1 Tax=Stakelama marina TaxID=2826939 RepID=A0A8T4ILF9_9SPHN|nr:DNA polymerase III subunit delta [Stakelama marina]MBR0552996.1 DNA polymerase III subunit delta [Stakelama marina]